ncbi:hypothetical protein DERF_010765 [Dermatophagoides farinae]|uniref:Uncharacterized protein n=1 Tax=Dermatophagoides farinae TaxID=6954 RepID=A0A922HRI2_DERFA|nr:hypothetical protein DERF_010765 [Dermatophagoides farinae]
MENHNRSSSRLSSISHHHHHQILISSKKENRNKNDNIIPQTQKKLSKSKPLNDKRRKTGRHQKDTTKKEKI